MSRYLTPPEVAELLRVDPDKVRRWIARGELRAFNVASSGCVRPRWRIDPDDLTAFTERRTPTVRGQRATRRADGVYEFFK